MTLCLQIVGVLAIVGLAFLVASFVRIYREQRQWERDNEHWRDDI